MPAGHVVKPLRIWLVGFGTVGRWVTRALDSQRARSRASTASV
jgi:homoserine dehydrogenase